jgi:hypothetical protein
MSDKSSHLTTGQRGARGCFLCVYKKFAMTDKSPEYIHRRKISPRGLKNPAGFSILLPV